MKTLLAALLVTLPLASNAQAPEGAWSAQPPERVPAVAPAPPPAGWAPAPPPHPGAAPHQPVAMLRPEKQRDTWYIGFGLGTGDGRVRDPDGTHQFDRFVGRSPTHLTLNFNVGATLSPKMLLGLDLSGVAASSTEDGVDSTIQVSNWNLALTYFPWERGLFLKAGAGLTALTVENALGEGTWRGANLLGGVGYAWWLGRSFNLTANLEVSAARYESNGPDGTRTWNGYLGFQWY